MPHSLLGGRSSAFSALGEIAIGVVVGVFSGLFGVGGGILLVPAIVTVLGMARKPAHATSLVALSIIASAGAVSFAAHGTVSWTAAALLALGGLLGAQLGVFFLTRMSDRWLSIGFGIFGITVALGLLLGSPESNEVTQQLTALRAVGFGATGLLAGVLSGLLGVGGGVVMIPVLVIFGGLGQHVAEGTALVAMIPITLMGAGRLTLRARRAKRAEKSAFAPAAASDGTSADAAGDTASVTNTDRQQDSAPHWPRGLRLGLGGLFGAPAGTFLAMHLSAGTLQRGFAIVVLGTTAHLLWTHLRLPRVANGATTSSDR